jgi:hypothetical protein
VLEAVNTAIRKGVLVVAASGNDGQRGNPLTYPASLPHVLTVAATGPTNTVAPFSSQSRFVDLAAPGAQIPVASALTRSYQSVDGTSFSAPMVAAAAAWVWTVRPELDASQLFEVIRRSARDLEPPGKDVATGYGLLNVPAALAHPAPIRDPLEPNDDISFLEPEGMFATGVAPLTTAARPTTRVAARLERDDDPRDLYRVWIPARATLTATASADGDIDLALWRTESGSVSGSAPARNRLARANTRGTTETLVYRNTGLARAAYLAVTPNVSVTEATYRMRVSAR